MDAVVRSGGKQYRVHEGSVFNVATLEAEPGSQVELNDVLLVSEDGNVTVGTPTVDGAVVVAEVVEHGKAKKVVNFKYKAKVRYRRKRGHRQPFTTLEVREIRAGGKTATAPARRQRRATAPAEETPAATDEPVAEAPEETTATAPEEPRAEAPEEPAAEAPAAPRRRRTTRSTRATQEPAAEAEGSAEGEAEAEKPAPRTRRRRSTSSESESGE